MCYSSRKKSFEVMVCGRIMNKLVSMKDNQDHSLHHTLERSVASLSVTAVYDVWKNASLDAILPIAIALDNLSQMCNT